ncbi:hypothetical protein PIB30_054489 [Stylosanthes scabra]|uniref:Retrotransposon gag domain-containing protein n=1 Tax=Stylosanthes scabra TaxID=79078 RepID=A0ABU6QJH0_9FABA|nr:hypothetical protein [Stylosanthes scabra]
MEEIPINNEGAGKSSHPLPTPEKEIDQRNQTIQQLEAALRELLERKTREAAIAMKAVKRPEELAKKQQAILDEAEKREKNRSEKLNNKIPIPVDDDSKIGESKDHTWRTSTVVTKAPGREKSKHLFSPHIIAEDLPKKFRYPVEIEPNHRTTDPKHHLDAFENRMLLVNDSDAIQYKAFIINLKKEALTWFNFLPPSSIESFSDLADSFMKNFTTRRRLSKTCLNLYSVGQKSEETLRVIWMVSTRNGRRLKEEGQTAIKIDRNKKDNPRKDHFREERGQREHKSNRSYYNPLSVSLAQFLH